jgi:hypothetical protein
MVKPVENDASLVSVVRLNEHALDQFDEILNEFIEDHPEFSFGSDRVMLVSLHGLTDEEFEDLQDFVAARAGDQGDNPF